MGGSPSQRPSLGVRLGQQVDNSLVGLDFSLYELEYALLQLGGTDPSISDFLQIPAKGGARTHRHS